MEQVKHTLEHVKEDAAKLLTSAPKGPLLLPRAAGIPRPRGPAQLPTSDEIHLAKQAQRAQEVQKDAECVSTSIDRLKDDSLPTGERAKQLWGVVRGFASKTMTTAAASTSRVIRETSINFDQKSFMEDFGQVVGPTSQYLNSFSASIVHFGKTMKVTVHVSTTHLCFDGNGVRDSIALTLIASLVPSVALPTSGDVPLFIPVPDPRVKVTGLQIFTTMNTVVQLLHVTHLLRHYAIHPTQNAVILLYAEVDRAWRSVSPVPLPQVSYE